MQWRVFGTTEVGSKPLMRALITIGFLLMGWAIVAQPYFNNRYDISDTTNLPDGGQSVLFMDTTILVKGWSSYDTRLINTVKVDPSGNFQSQNLIIHDSLNYHSGLMHRTADDKIVMGGYVWKDTIYYPTLYLMNLDGDTLWTESYGTGVGVYRELGHDAISTQEGGFILIGDSKKDDYPTSDLYLIKTDVNGNVEWDKTIGGSNTDYGWEIDTIAGGGYAIAGTTWSYGPNADVYVARLDTGGNVMWYDNIGDQWDDTAFPHVMVTSENKILFAGANTVNDDVFKYTRKWAALYDTLGNQLWEKMYADTGRWTGFSGIVETNEGDFVLIGVVPDDGPGTAIGDIWKLNNNGDSIWSREYRLATGSLSMHYTTDIDLTDNNGFVVSGYIQIQPPDTGDQDVWVVRLDSMGCVTPGCHLVGIEEPMIVDVQLTAYPNPSRGIYTIDLPDIPRNNSSLKIFNSVGSLVRELSIADSQSSIVLDISNEPSGFYLLHLQTNMGIVLGRVVKE